MCRLISATINGCEHAKHLGRMGGYCVGSRRPAIVRLRGGPKRLPEAWGSGSSSTFLNSYIRKSISPYADNRKLSDEYVPRCLRFGASGGDAAEAHIFDFDEFVDAVFGAFAAKAGFFYAAEEDFRSFGLGVADVAFDFLNGGVVNERSLRGAGFEAGSGLQRFDGHGELGSENVVDGVLNQQAIRAHASLAGIAILGGDGA